MKTKVRISPEPTIKQLRAEVATLRSFVISIAGRDPEGAYRPEFVIRVLEAAQEKPTLKFKNARQFLELLAEAE